MLIFHHLVVPAGTEGRDTLYTPPPPRACLVKRMEIYFPPGDADELQVAFYRGDMQVYPRQGVFVGDSVKWVVEEEERWEAGQPIVISYRNLNPAYARVVDILAHIELV